MTRRMPVLALTLTLLTSAHSAPMGDQQGLDAMWDMMVWLANRISENASSTSTRGGQPWSGGTMSPWGATGATSPWTYLNPSSPWNYMNPASPWSTLSGSSMLSPGSSMGPGQMWSYPAQQAQSYMPGWGQGNQMPYTGQTIPGQGQYAGQPGSGQWQATPGDYGQFGQGYGQSGLPGVGQQTGPRTVQPSYRAPTPAERQRLQTLQGVWESPSGQRWIVEGNRFRVQSGPESFRQGWYEVSDARLIAHIPDAGLQREYFYVQAGDKLMLQDRAGNAFLFRRVQR